MMTREYPEGNVAPVQQKKILGDENFEKKLVDVFKKSFLEVKQAEAVDNVLNRISEGEYASVPPQNPGEAVNILIKATGVRENLLSSLGDAQSEGLELYREKTGQKSSRNLNNLKY